MTGKPRRLAFVIGARPELIKLAPVIAEANRRPGLLARVLFTGQHRELLDQVADYFGISADRDLDVMRADQSLPDLTARLLTALDPVLAEERPDLVVAQGDTTSVLAAAMAAFYRRVPFAHVEAGLRSGTRSAPFPEEINRRLVTALADLHFAPTEGARDSLLSAGVPTRNVHVTGNTIVDAVSEVLRHDLPPALLVSPGRPVILVTVHRRENLGPTLHNLVGAIRRIALARTDVEIIWPLHPRPEIRRVASDGLAALPNVHLLDPLDYGQFIAEMKRATLIMTDSGGVQEEAPTLRVPVLVLRDVTERPEGVAAGVALLVGTDPDRIVDEALRVLDDDAARLQMTSATNPYGDGRASIRIVDHIEQWLARDVTRAGS